MQLLQSEWSPFFPPGFRISKIGFHTNFFSKYPTANENVIKTKTLKTSSNLKSCKTFEGKVFGQGEAG